MDVGWTKDDTSFTTAPLPFAYSNFQPSNPPTLPKKKAPRNSKSFFQQVNINYLTGILNVTSLGGKHCVSLHTINSILPLTVVVALFNFTFC